MAKILLLDDDHHIRRVIELHLSKQGHETVAGKDGQEGLDRLRHEPFDLLITDLKMPNLTGFELLKALREQHISIPVLVLTAFATIESAVEAMKFGADDFICKPPQLDEITIKVANLLARQSLIEENQRLKKALEEKSGFASLVGNSPVMRTLLERVKVLARDADISILLTGESGTGKEILARAIHYNSPRAQAPFVAINCGAVPEELIESELFGHEKGAFTGAATQKKGLFEVAHRGTLFLDEISAMPQTMQVKLLRALEAREIRRVGSTLNLPIDIRILAASNQNLEELLEEKSFREDLYYRLAVATVTLPPLRNRTGDVPLLVNHFLEYFNHKKNRQVSVDEETLKLLEAYAWRGNVRELEHLVELLVVTSPANIITAAQLPERILATRSSDTLGVNLEDLGNDLKAATKQVIAQFEGEFILRQLEKSHWNITRTAAAIGLSRGALHAKMKDYGIE